MRILALLLVFLARSSSAPAQDNLKKVVSFPNMSKYPVSQGGCGDLLHLAAREAGIPINYEAPLGRPYRQFDSADVSVEQLLNRLIASDQRLEWHLDDGMVLIRPRTAWNGGRTALDARVEGFALSATRLGGAMSAILRLLNRPTIMGDTSERTVHTDPEAWPVFSVSVAEGTVLDVLNATAKARGRAMWRVRYGEDYQHPVAISFCTFEGAGSLSSISEKRK